MKWADVSWMVQRFMHLQRSLKPHLLRSIVVMSKNRRKVARIFGASQGSADDVGQEGPLGGADAGLRQKDRYIWAVFGHNDYK
ncbi:MAG: hypothetical protein FWC77_03910 [Defluviitaleaceae bacterium]|nr:hypothetical protein [Defluviitaleaceae bacterium]